jgi:hypothetical protein
MPPDKATLAALGKIEALQGSSQAGAATSKFQNLLQTLATLAKKDAGKGSTQASTTTYDFKNFLQILQRQHEVIRKMELRATRVQQDTEHLLDLKQRQASLFEAHFAGLEAEEQRQLLDEARLQT